MKNFFFKTGCTDNGIEYQEGDIWPSVSDPCKVCECSDGLVSCRNKQICLVRCSHGIVKRGECCQDCSSKYLYVEIGQG